MTAAACGFDREASGFLGLRQMVFTTNLIVGSGIAAVAFVLVLGLINMLRGGSPNLSQKLMRWRVGVQFAVIIIIMGILWYRS